MGKQDAFEVAGCVLQQPGCAHAQLCSFVAASRDSALLLINQPDVAALHPSLDSIARAAVCCMCCQLPPPDSPLTSCWVPTQRTTNQSWVLLLLFNWGLLSSCPVSCTFRPIPLPVTLPYSTCTTAGVWFQPHAAISACMQGVETTRMSRWHARSFHEGFLNVLFKEGTQHSGPHPGVVPCNICRGCRLLWGGLSS